MPHPCRSGFWGVGADVLIQWIDYLNAELAPLTGPAGDGSVCHLTPLTYDSLCVLHSMIEAATAVGGGAPKPCANDAMFDPGVEAEFRQVVQVMTALLVADQYDNSPPHPHDQVPNGWMWTPAGSGNPEPGAMDRLVGRGTPPVLDPNSVLGKVRNALGT